MKDKKSSVSRRKLLKSIAAGSGAVIAGKSLPENWSRPVVDSVLLPAHAQTSPTLQTVRVDVRGDWTVPANIASALSIVAYGAAGRSGGRSGANLGGVGGNGGMASVTITATAGETLTIQFNDVGSGGTSAGTGGNGGGGGRQTRITYSGAIGELRAAGGGAGGGAGGTSGSNNGGDGGAGESGLDGSPGSVPGAAGGIYSSGGGLGPLAAPAGSDALESGGGGGGAGGNNNSGGGGAGGAGFADGIFVAATFATSTNVGDGYVEFTFSTL